MWNNIESVAEEHISSEMYTCILLWITDHDEYVPTIEQTNYSQQTNEQTKVIQEVVSPEVPKLNHVAVNKKRDQKCSVLSKKD